MPENLKNGIKISVGQAVLELLIKTVFRMFLSVSQEPLGLPKFICHLEFLNSLLQHAYNIIFQESVGILRDSAQNMFNLGLKHSSPKVFNPPPQLTGVQTTEESEHEVFLVPFSFLEGGGEGEPQHDFYSKYCSVNKCLKNMENMY